MSEKSKRGKRRQMSSIADITGTILRDLSQQALDMLAKENILVKGSETFTPVPDAYSNPKKRKRLEEVLKDISKYKLQYGKCVKEIEDATPATKKKIETEVEDDGYVIGEDGLQYIRDEEGALHLAFSAELSVEP